MTLPITNSHVNMICVVQLYYNSDLTVNIIKEKLKINGMGTI